ncbi:MAG: bifunctional adenosylcobinamide kinase/adenosylcobinamide-phosphate guanylyltransferase [Oscillospiraceae bacterium]|nr:bifunctional adenosylcobinamide kinase/adenosylcobinamide-phosphate guanylyltransferase [Oscillospiraceae bacterium]
MLLITGGSGSGKSAYAERTLLSRMPPEGGGRAVYLATMENTGPEAAARVARHRAMRARHGEAAGRTFVTLEQPVDLGGAAVLPGDFVLVEDLGNLLANELWSPAGAGRAGAEARILSGVKALMERAALLAVVSVDIFAGGDGYAPEILDYIRTLGRLHRTLAALAEESAEVVCGIPLAGKGLPAYNEHRPAAPAGQEA